LIAIFIYFRTEIKELLFAAVKIIIQLFNPLGFPDLFKRTPACSVLVFLLIATFMTGILGFLFYPLVTASFSNLKTLGICWLITCLLLIIAQSKLNIPSIPKKMHWSHSIWIGLFQGLALFPGISRSGATLTAGLICGLSKEKAFRFAFLLAIPSISMAFVGEAYQQKDTFMQIDQWTPYIVGFIVSAITSYFALKFLHWLLVRKQLVPFILYCFVAGIVALIL